MRRFTSVEDMESEVGKEVAVSDWLVLTQERVQQFSEATDDPHWIHVDVERAKRESPFGGTVAHGFLTLSLLPKFIEQVIDMPPGKMSINYGLNKVRFPAPMPVGRKIRGRFTLLSIERIEGGVQSIWQVTMECDGGDKPVCVAESVLRRYF